MSGNVKVTSGVNEMNLELVGQSTATVKHQLDTLLNLSGDEKIVVNGAEVAGDYILEDGDHLEFVKESGTKGTGSVKVVSGVNEMNLEIVGKTVGDVRREMATLLSLDADVSAEVNGECATDSTLLCEGDRLEFVKESGTKGC
jgi:uncharacterized protein with beta-barrel porin domain